LPSTYKGTGQCRYCGNPVTLDPPIAAAAEGLEFAPEPDIAPMPEVSEPPSIAIEPEPEPEQKPEPQPEPAPEPLISEVVEPAPSPAQVTATKRSRIDINALIAGAFTNSAVKPKGRQKPLPPAGKRVPPPAPVSRTPWQNPSMPFVPSIQRLGGTPSGLPPRLAALAKPPADPETPQKQTACGICHAPIAMSDEVKSCPGCNLSFHAECWIENRGCSSYGCTEVGVLDRQ
jgi:hypothetical protein